MKMMFSTQTFCKQWTTIVETVGDWIADHISFDWANCWWSFSKRSTQFMQVGLFSWCWKKVNQDWFHSWMLEVRMCGRIDSMSSVHVHDWCSLIPCFQWSPARLHNNSHWRWDTEAVLKSSTIYTTTTNTPRRTNVNKAVYSNVTCSDCFIAQPLSVHWRWSWRPVVHLWLALQ